MNLPIGRRAFFVVFWCTLSAAALVIFGEPFAHVAYGAGFSLPELPPLSILGAQDPWLEATSR